MPARVRDIEKKLDERFSTTKRVSETTSPKANHTITRKKADFDLLKKRARQAPHQTTISTYKKTSDPELKPRETVDYYRSDDPHPVREMLKTKKNEAISFFLHIHSLHKCNV